jgi:membrane protein implicated in regulation of membrane protease activity
VNWFDAMLEEPAVVLLAVAAATALFLIEAALPTVGIAGTMSLLLGAVAVAGIAHQDADWWPLAFVVFALGVWGVLIARRSGGAVGQAIAALSFAGGSIGFGIAADDAPAIITGIVTSVVLAAGFPRLLDAANRLLNQPSQVGVEAFIGREAEIIEWDGAAGRVRIEGSLWNARSATPLPVRAGDHVRVRGAERMTLEVELASQPATPTATGPLTGGNA